MKSAIVGLQSRLATYNIIRRRDAGMGLSEPLPNNPAGPVPRGHACGQHCIGYPRAKRVSIAMPRSCREEEEEEEEEEEGSGVLGWGSDGFG